MTADQRTGDPDLAFCLACCATFTSIVALTISALTLLARWNLPTPHLAVLGPLLVLASAAFAPFALPTALATRLRTVAFVFPLVSLGVLLLPALVAPVIGRGVLLMHLVIAGLGIARALPHIMRMNVLLMMAAPLLGRHVFAEFNSFGAAHVFAPESALLGLANPDTLHHAAIAQMLQHFGRLSMGFDGLVQHQHHVGSHLWFAGMSTATGAPMIVTYTFAQATALVPALLLALYQASTCVAVRKDPILTIGASSVLVAVIDQLGVPTYYISESFTLGLIVYVAWMPLLVHESTSMKATCGTVTLLAGVVLSAVGFVIKVSTGALMMAALLYLAVRRRGMRRSTLVVGAVTAGIAAASTIAFVPRYYLSFRLLAAIPELHDPRWIMPLLVSGSYLFLKTRMGHARARGGDLLTEVVMVTAVVAWMPMLVLAVPVAHYLYQTLLWMVLPLWIAELNLDLRVPDPYQRRWVVASVLMLMVVVFGAPSATDPVRQLKQQLYDRTGSGLTTLRAPMTESAQGPSFLKRLQDSEGARIVAAVEGGVHAAQGRVAVFVEPSYSAFWGMHDQCWAQSFFIPALTGLPMLKGLPPDQQCVYWGYQAYLASSRSEPTTDAELCVAARERDVDAVFVLADARRADRNRLLQCSTNLRLPAT